MEKKFQRVTLILAIIFVGVVCRKIQQSDFNIIFTLSLAVGILSLLLFFIGPLVSKLVSQLLKVDKE